MRNLTRTASLAQALRHHFLIAADCALPWTPNAGAGRALDCLPCAYVCTSYESARAQCSSKARGAAF